ncbi:hypothetical protein [Butyrivibrio fibrisolvens]|uniref:hypothetical protein n=1 Tax=Butyrivibrio fibrisolvens TaxID=831 RepID=UPI000412F14B|nr:hypothetical protein [Butyrivibrio fibrisolvens]
MFINNDGFYKDKDGFWFIGRSNAVLYYLNDEFECTPVTCLTEDEGDCYRLYQKCVCCNDKVYCLPDRADSIGIYDIKQDQFNRIYIEENENRRLSILSAYDMEGTLWCVSNGLGKIIEFSLLKESVSGIYEIFDKNYDDQNEYSGEESVIVDNKIICISKNEPTIVIFDICSKRLKRIDLNLNEKGFNTISYKDGKFVLSGYKSNIYLWDGQSDSVEIVALEREGFLTGLYNNYEIPIFFNSCCVGNKVVFSLFDYQAEKGLVAFGLEDGTVYRIIDDNKETNRGEHYVFECLIEEGLLIHLDNDKFAMSLIEDSLNLNIGLNMKVAWKKNNILNRIRRKMKDNVFLESAEFRLNDYIQVSNEL